MQPLLFIAIAKFAFYGLLIAFLWAYRHVSSKSLPWVVAYLLISISLAFLVPLLTRYVIDTRLSGGQEIPFGWTLGSFIANWTYFNLVVDGLANVLLALLALSDLSFFLAQAGVVPATRFLLPLRHVRKQSMPLGMTLVLLLCTAPLAMLLLWASTIA